MRTNLYLARHGQTLWNKVRRFQGQLDSQLTEIGRQQSASLAQQLTHKKIDFIVSSSLGRAVASANICQEYLNVPVVYHDGLMERHLGHWQGEHIERVNRDNDYHEMLHQFTELTPKGGESAIQCGSRIQKTLASITKNYESKNLLIIFHGEALRCLLAKLGESFTDNAYQLFDNGCLIQLTYDQQSNHFQLVR